jgi:hypothetical protein
VPIFNGVSILGMLNHACDILRREEVVSVMGYPSYVTSTIATDIPCRLDLGVPQQDGSDGAWSPEQRREFDQSGVLYVQPDCQILPGDRVLMTFGASPGRTYEVAGDPSYVYGKYNAHHREIRVKEVVSGPEQHRNDQLVLIMQKPCLTCGELTHNPSRCDECNCRRPDRPYRLSYRQRGYDGNWDRLSKRARKLQPWCNRCGAIDQLSLDHLPIAWARKAAGKSIRLSDCQVLCEPCQNQLGGSRPGSDRYKAWELSLQ